jgi:hypothetical protein
LKEFNPEKVERETEQCDVDAKFSYAIPSLGAIPQFYSAAEIKGRHPICPLTGFKKI